MKRIERGTPQWLQDILAADERGMSIIFNSSQQQWGDTGIFNHRHTHGWLEKKFFAKMAKANNFLYMVDQGFPAAADGASFRIVCYQELSDSEIASLYIALRKQDFVAEYGPSVEADKFFAEVEERHLAATA